LTEILCNIVDVFTIQIYTVTLSIHQRILKKFITVSTNILKSSMCVVSLIYHCLSQRLHKMEASNHTFRKCASFMQLNKNEEKKPTIGVNYETHV